jgi:hypothetical protein
MLQILLLLSLVDITIIFVIEIPKFALMTGLSKKMYITISVLFWRIKHTLILNMISLLNNLHERFKFDRRSDHICIICHFSDLGNCLEK